MQSLLAISWFPTAALICGLVFGVLTLSCACLMIIKEQRPSGLSILLAILGSLLLVVSIWQSRSGSMNELKAQIADLEQQNQQLAKELETTSGQQQTERTVLNDNNSQLKTAIINLQNSTDSHRQKIDSIYNAQSQIDQALDKIQNEINQQAQQIQDIVKSEKRTSSETQNQLQHITDKQSTDVSEHQQLLNQITNDITQLKINMATTSENYSKQLENLEKQRLARSSQTDHTMKQHQTELDSLREDIEAATSQKQGANLVQASTQRELSSLRRELNRLQENIQRLQGRRQRVQ